jgi:hypothetical protein
VGEIPFMKGIGELLASPTKQCNQVSCIASRNDSVDNQVVFILNVNNAFPFYGLKLYDHSLPALEKGGCPGCMGEQRPQAAASRRSGKGIARAEQLV